MFARAVHMKVNGSAESIAAAWAQAKTAHEGIDGLEELYLLDGAGESREVIVLSLWESQIAAQNAVADRLCRALGGFGPLLTEPTRTAMYEVGAGG